MDKGYTLIAMLTLYLLTGMCNSQNTCGTPSLCLCFDARVVCIGENVFMFPTFREPQRKSTRILSIDSTRIRHLTNFKLQQWENLSHLIIVGNTMLVQCADVVSNIRIHAEQKGIIVYTSCGDSTTTPDYITTSDQESTIVFTSERGDITTQSNTITYDVNSYTSSSLYTTITSEGNTTPTGNNLTHWMKPVFITLGILSILMVLIFIIHIVITMKNKSKPKKTYNSSIYLPTVHSSHV